MRFGYICTLDNHRMRSMAESYNFHSFAPNGLYSILFHCFQWYASASYIKYCECLWSTCGNESFSFISSLGLLLWRYCAIGLNVLKCIWYDATSFSVCVCLAFNLASSVLSIPMRKLWTTKWFLRYTDYTLNWLFVSACFISIFYISIALLRSSWNIILVTY